MFMKLKFLLLLFCLQILFNSPNSFASTELNVDDLKYKFNIFIEKEFLKNKIKTKQVSRKNWMILDLKNNEYQVDFDLVNKSLNINSGLIPMLKIIRTSDNVSISSVRALTYTLDANVLVIENIAKMLVSETINTMISQNITFSKFDKILQDQSKKKINVTLIGFNNCENNEIVEIMEKEFPGFHHLEVSKSSTFKINNYYYYTNATVQKIQKWTTQIMMDFGFSMEDFFIKIYKDNFELIKTNKNKKIYICQ